MSELRLEHIKKTYHNHMVLKDFSYEFTHGVYGILGPNGAGKTTLMRVITDSLKWDCGEVFFDDKPIRSMGRSYRKQIGFVPQSQKIYSDMYVRQFLYYIASLKGLNKKKADFQIEKSMESLHLKGFEKKKMEQLSGGMRQRVMMAQALLGNPQLLILDEPTAGVDPKERIEIRSLIEEQAKDKIVLLSTHIVSDVETIYKEIIFLRDGEIVGVLNRDSKVESLEKEYMRLFGE